MMIWENKNKSDTFVYPDRKKKKKSALIYVYV